MSDNRVKVGVRVRPLLGMEVEAGAESVIKCSCKRVTMSVPSKKNTFDFDWCFGPTTSHRDVYDQVCKPLVKNIFEGFNATVFAYGQTGSGKTFTMGNGADATEGVIPFAIDDMFAEKIACEAKGMSASLEMSFMEVYMEDCYDLLSSDRSKIDLRETSKGETYPEGLTIRTVASADAVRSLLSEAAQVRSTGRTAMNAHSSRSHAICTFYLRILPVVSQTDTENTDVISRAIVSKLHLVDLAGSERAKKTQATGDVFAEGVSINKGLLALGNVIVALSTQGKENGHIPYRDSKITRLLKDSLGGNGKTVMLACASPADVNFEETLNTLRFASRASTIVNNAHVNIDESDLIMDDGRALPPSVAKELVCLRTQNTSLQQQVDAMSCIISTQSSATSDATMMSKYESFESAKCLLSCIMEMVIAQKSLLIKCLEEDFTLEDKEVEGMAETIDNAKKLIGMHTLVLYKDFAHSDVIASGGDKSLVLCGSSKVAEVSVLMDVNFLPPIMKLIEDLEKLQDVASSAIDMLSSALNAKSDSKIAKKKGMKAAIQRCPIVETDRHGEFQKEGSSVDAIMAACCEDSEELDLEEGDDGRSDSEDDYSIEEGFAADEAAAIQEKDTNVLNIIKIAEQYKATIMALRSEISNLEIEKNSLVLKEAKDKKTDTVASISNTKIQKELLEKTKSLELKLKQLRQKEVEYARIYQEKEKARRDAEQLRKELTEALKKRVAASKKMKEESEHHLAEKKKLQQAEMQSRRRELQAQSAVQKLNKEFLNRERVLRGQLEVKEREVKRQKELILKQQKVKAAREAGPSKRFSGLGSVALSVRTESSGLSTGNSGGQNEFSVSAQRATALDLWLSQEVNTQAKRNILSEEIEGMMESRAKISKKLHALKSQRGAAETAIGTCGFTRESEVKHMEDEVRAKSIALAKHQGMLADLGTVVEKRRFAGITDHKETKYIMHWMFQKLSKEGPLHQKAMDAKLIAQDEQIEQLKKMLSAAESQIQLLQEHTVADPALETSGSNLIAAREVTCTTIRKRSGSSMSSGGAIEQSEFETYGLEKVVHEHCGAEVAKGRQMPQKVSSAGAELRNKVLLTAKSVNAAINSVKDTKGSTSIIPHSATIFKGSEKPSLTDIYYMSSDERDASFDDLSSVDDPLDESFRPPSDDDTDYDEEEGLSRKPSRKKKTAKQDKNSFSSTSSTVSGKKRSISDISVEMEGVDRGCSSNLFEPSTKRFSPTRSVTTSGDSRAHFSRRRSVGSTTGDGIKIKAGTPGRQSLASGIDADKKSLTTRKLRRTSVTGLTDLEFVHTESTFDKENQINLKERLLPPNIESYSVRDLKDLLGTRGLTQSGKKAELIARLRAHAGYYTVK